MIGTGMAHLEEEPPDAGLPPDLSFAIRQALEKEPASRPPSASAYATMLQVAAR
jgi:hypothetical protein